MSINDVMYGATTFLVALAASVAIFLFLRWAWRDGRRRGRPPVAVCLFVLCFFPVGWLAWLVFRPDLREQSARFARRQYT